MSLVEKALKKLQESRETAALASHTARPRPAVERETRPLVAPEPAPRIAPEPTPRVAPVAEEARRVPAAKLAPNTNKVIVVNKGALRAVGLLPPEHQERQIADQYRQIKRPLVVAALNKGSDALRNAQFIMVSSALPGDGKTFTSINLSISISREKDIHVLLVDADVAKPHISQLLGVAQEPGLLDALHDPSIDIESLILPTDIPGLSVLPAGRRSETATELLASQRMETLVDALAKRDATRIVVIDSPPLLLTSESRALAQRVGQIVLVVRAGKTLQQDLLDALSHLEQGKSIGLVLNQSVNSTSGYYYGYGDAERLSVPS